MSELSDEDVGLAPTRASAPSREFSDDDVGLGGESTGQTLMRAPGRAARMVLEGVPQIPDMLANGVAAIGNAPAVIGNLVMPPQPSLSGLITGEAPQPRFREPFQYNVGSRAGTGLADALGLPQYDSSPVGQGVGAVGPAVAGGGAANLAARGLAPLLRGAASVIARAFTDAPVLDAAANATGATAQEVVRQNDGGAGAQMGANLGGSILPSLAVALAARGRGAAGAGAPPPVMAPEAPPVLALPAPQRAAPAPSGPDAVTAEVRALQQQRVRLADTIARGAGTEAPGPESTGAQQLARIDARLAELDAAQGRGGEQIDVPPVFATPEGQGAPRFTEGAVVPTEPQPSRMTPGDVTRARAQMEGGNPNTAEPPPRFVAPEGRAPQTPDQVQQDRQAGEAFRQAEAQRTRANPEVRDTQPAPRPEGVASETVHLDQGFPVRIIGRDDKGFVSVERYDPRTGQADPEAPPYVVRESTLQRRQYAAQPRQAQDFTARSGSPRDPEMPREPGPGRPQQEPRQTYRTTAEDPNTDFPGATRPGPEDGAPPPGRSPLPGQPEGPHPGRAWSTAEEAERAFQQRRAQADAEARRARETGEWNSNQRSTNQPGARDVEGRWPTGPGGYVASSAGGPIRFGDQKQAARWILAQGQKHSPDQFFEIAVHPSGEGFTVREAGRNAGPPPGGGGARPAEGAPRDPADAPLPLPPPAARGAAAEATQGPPAAPVARDIGATKDRGVDADRGQPGAPTRAASASGTPAAAPRGAVAPERPAAGMTPDQPPAGGGRGDAADQAAGASAPGRAAPAPSLRDAKADKLDAEAERLRQKATGGTPSPTAASDMARSPGAKRVLAMVDETPGLAKAAEEANAAAARVSNEFRARALRDAGVTEADLAAEYRSRTMGGAPDAERRARVEAFQQAAADAQRAERAAADAARAEAARKHGVSPERLADFDRRMMALGDGPLGEVQAALAKLAPQDGAPGAPPLYSNPIGDPAAIKRFLLDPAMRAAVSLRNQLRSSTAARAFSTLFDSNRGDLFAFRDHYPHVPEIGHLTDQLASDPGTGRVVKATYESAVTSRRQGTTNRIFAVLGKGIDETTARQVRDAMTGGRAASPEVAAQARQIRGILDEHHKYLKAAGVEVGRQENYFPRQYDEEAIRSDPAGFRTAVQKQYEVAGLKPADAADAARAFTDEVTGQATMGFRNEALLSANSLKDRSLPPSADAALAQWMVTDPRVALSRYIARTTRVAEFTRRFGKNGELAAEWFSRMARQGVAPDHIEQMRARFQSATGTLDSGTGVPAAAAMAGWLQTAGILARLTGSVITSLPEVLAVAARAGAPQKSITLLADMFRDTAKNADLRQARQLAEMYGVISTSGPDMTLAAQAGVNGADSSLRGKVNDGLFRLNGLHALTDKQRVVATRHGSLFVRQMVDEIADGASTKASAARLMAELGMDEPAAVALSKFLRSDPSSAELLGSSAPAQSYRTAITRFVNEAIQNPEAIDKPLWASHPIGRLAYGITSFQYAFTRNMVFRTFKQGAEAVTGSGYSLQDRARLAGPLAGMAVLMAAQAAVSDARDRIGNSQQRAERDPLVTNVAIADRLGIFANLSPVVNMALSARYQADPATRLAGPYVSNVTDTLKALLGTIPQSLGGPNSPNTNNAEHKLAEVIYGGVLAPAVVAGLSLAQGALPAPVKVAAGAAAIAMTRPGARRGFADAVVGEKTVQSRTPGGAGSGYGGLPSGGGLR